MGDASMLRIPELHASGRVPVALELRWRGAINLSDYRRRMCSHERRNRSQRVDKRSGELRMRCTSDDDEQRHLVLDDCGELVWLVPNPLVPAYGDQPRRAVSASQTISGQVGGK